MLEGIWHPSLLTFLGVSAVPIYLLIARKNLGGEDKGYMALLFGGLIISLASLIDYLEELPVLKPLVLDLNNGLALNQTFLPFAYAAGTILIAYGLANWFPGIIRLAKEIRSREKKEDELKALAKELEGKALEANQSNSAKSEFLATMSHELRTPLNAVIGYAQMLKLGIVPMDSIKAREYLDHIESSGSHLLSILNDILDLSKLEAGRFEVHNAPFDLDQVIQDSLAFCQPLALAKQLPIQYQKTEVKLKSDERILKQIVINILSNAVKFTPALGSIDLFVTPHENTHILHITDTGLGMSPEELDKAVQPFQQLESSFSRSQEGTGLGLALVMRLSQLIDVTIEVNSVKKKGTEVLVKLPVSSILQDEKSLGDADN
ncbi:HAMP domain-containing sensor histidine kinase [Temperatibacter marinus]|uniref:histidine kinase n=1 Tax=Temperatibacter marinus TaxID=1456591 RepID=A0AA52EJ29_9PROT|nr:HAMP domain-containing sensor histidine kinase [Temperatibacter marinus]WND03447.1 HAMP domain-containing sensor histidine kinase [Temperatibacter marinus]